MPENTDTGDESLENLLNSSSEKPSDENIPSIDPDITIPHQETRNMETHAHHLHNAPGNKFWHYFFEFLMLFLAITLGFFVENMRELNTEHHRENQYMRSLIKDVEQDIRNIETDILNRNQKNQIADSLANLLLSDNYQNQTSLIYFCARRFSIVGYVFHMTDGTLMQLKNSGGLRIIRNQDIVDSLQSYYNLYQQHEDNRQLDMLQLRDYRDIMIQVFDVRIFDTMIKNFPETIIPIGNPPLFSNDHLLINELLMRVQLSKRINQVNIQYLIELKEKAARLKEQIKKDYHLK